MSSAPLSERCWDTEAVQIIVADLSHFGKMPAMSLGLAIKVPEGVILAAESRVTLAVNLAGQQVPIFFDNATKMFGFEPPNNFCGLLGRS